MNKIKTAISTVALIGAFVILPLTGCSQTDAPTVAPPITGKVKDWKTMTKAEKIELIKKQPMPEDARQNELKKIEAGQD